MAKKKRKTPGAASGAAKPSHLARSWKLDAAAVTLIAIVLIAAYANSLGTSFQFDDDPRIRFNKGIRSFHDLKEYSPFFHGKRSVVYFTIWVNYRMGGSSPTIYHLSNLLFHLGNCILIYLIISRILIRNRTTQGDSGGSTLRWRLVALGAALLFGAHPIQAQAVTYIIQRAELLAAFFQLTALLCYWLGRTSRSRAKASIFIAATVVSYVLAIESKEQAAIFPVILVLFELLVVRKRALSLGKEGIFRFLAPLVLILLLTVPFLLNLSRSYSGDTAAGFDIKGISQKQYALTNLRVFFTYLRLLVLPVNQNLDHEFPLSHSLLNPPSTLIAMLGLVAIAALGVFLAWKKPLYSFGILFFIVALAPSSSFIPIVDVIFEHRLYFPAFGFFLIIALLFEGAYHALESRDIKWRNAAIAGISTLLILGCAIATVRRNTVWRTPITLWTDVVRKSPGKARGHTNLGNEHFKLFSELKEKGRAKSPQARKHLETALEESLKAIELAGKERRPNTYLMVNTYTNLWYIYYDLGEKGKALDALRQAVKNDPLNPNRYLNLLDGFRNLDLVRESEAYVEDLKTRNPDLWDRISSDPRIRMALAENYLRLGLVEGTNDQGKEYGPGFDAEKAVAALEKSIEYKPSAEAHYSLARLQDFLGHKSLALDNYRRALEVKPAFASSMPSPDPGAIRQRIRQLE